MDDTINRDNLHRIEGDWKEYRPKKPKKALFIEGEFTVDTSEGVVTVKDEYLVLDPQGYPHTWPKGVFENIYEEVEN